MLVERSRNKLRVSVGKLFVSVRFALMLSRRALFFVACHAVYCNELILSELSSQQLLKVSQIANVVRSCECYIRVLPLVSCCFVSSLDWQ